MAASTKGQGKKGKFEDDGNLYLETSPRSFVYAGKAASGDTKEQALASWMHGKGKDKGKDKGED